MEPQIAQAFQLIPYGIFLLIAGPLEKERVTVVSWVSQISYSPPLLLCALRFHRPALDFLGKGNFYSLNLLKRQQVALVPKMKHFSSLDIPGLNFSREFTGAVYFQEALASWICQVHSTLPYGDHILVVGQVQKAYSTEGWPLTTLDYGKTYLGEK